MLSEATVQALIKWSWLFPAGLLVMWFVGRELRRLVDAVDRVPSKEWFTHVRQRIDSMPDAKRLEAHFAAVHALQTAAQTSTNTQQILRRDVDELRKDVDAVADRLRVVEVEQAKYVEAMR